MAYRDGRDATKRHGRSSCDALSGQPARFTVSRQRYDARVSDDGPSLCGWLLRRTSATTCSLCLAARIATGAISEQDEAIGYPYTLKHLPGQA